LRELRHRRNVFGGVIEGRSDIMQYLGQVLEQLSTPDRDVRRARRHRANRQRARLRRTRRTD
jgi:hypothetical protein